MTSDLEARIRTLEDIEAIRHLKARHYRAVDTGDVESLVSVFTDDCVWESGIFGRVEGAAEMRRLAEEMPRRLKFSVHYITNSAIEIDGDRGFGKWYGFVACTLAASGKAAWGATVVNEEYARIDGIWKIRKFVQEPQFWTPFDQGWVEERFVSSVHKWVEAKE